MKIKYVDLNTFLKSKVTDATMFTRSASIALGMALGRSYPLPSQAPQAARSYYAEDVARHIDRSAAIFNENIVIDIDLTSTVARAVWLVRCGLCHPDSYIDSEGAAAPGDALVGLSNAGYALSQDVYDFMNANKAVLFVMANRINSIMSGDTAERVEPKPEDTP